MKDVIRNKTLILGANGATGKQAVSQLLSMGRELKLMVRPTAILPAEWLKNECITLIKASISDTGIDDMASYVEDCRAVISCLGHNVSFKGMYGKPLKLVTDATKLVCAAIEKNKMRTSIKVILMNTAGNRNKDLNEPISIAEKIIVGMLRLCIPPHPDNEKAAEYLRVQIGQNHPRIEWCAVRPDSLINADEVSKYNLHPSPTSSAIFKPRKTSRNIVGNFMAKLVLDDEIWQKWKGKMPVIYNAR